MTQSLLGRDGRPPEHQRERSVLPPRAHDACEVGLGAPVVACANHLPAVVCFDAAAWNSRSSRDNKSIGCTTAVTPLPSLGASDGMSCDRTQTRSNRCGTSTTRVT